LIYNRDLSIVSTSRNVGEVLEEQSQGLIALGNIVQGGFSLEENALEFRNPQRGNVASVFWQARPAGSGRKAMRIAAAAGLAACVGAIAGCGNTYRPVVATIGVVGPAGQPTKYAMAVSSPTPVGSPCPAAGQPTSDGLLTMVDFSGDSVLVTATLGQNPYFLALNASGTTGYTLNCDKTLTSFDISTSLISSQVLESTLAPGANPVDVFTTATQTYLADPGISAIDQMTGTPPALEQELPIASGYTPIYMVGQSGASRIYAISQSTTGGPGQAEAIEISGNTISATLPVGRGPVYGVMTVDDRRAFVLNQTDGTVTVINAQNDALDTPVNTIKVGTRPVWADLASGLDELVVANEGTGTTPGSVTIINIPLCSATALPTNPNCDPSNPIDATTFGQIVTTIPVGINPIMVSVLSDYSRAYVANAGVASLPCSPTGIAVPGVSTTCTVSVVNLTTDTVTATIPIAGHPVYIATSDATPTGKVYVVCNDSQVMSVIETDTDSLDTTVPLQGYGVSVRVTAP
jgi:DNA-binding beta-propeller fold protein YncE